ncbi:hypothetical protein MKEN_00539900 [Mycena kentingensis (nom. inval.)]|nr:hypothetical protein MKEN_00539900 [Mycena kentingensis (nom. inval.)]
MFSDLPNELIHAIASLCPKKTLISFCCVDTTIPLALSNGVARRPISAFLRSLEASLPRFTQLCVLLLDRGPRQTWNAKRYGEALTIAGLSADWACIQHWGDLCVTLDHVSLPTGTGTAWGKAGGVWLPRDLTELLTHNVSGPGVPEPHVLLQFKWLLIGVAMFLGAPALRSVFSDVQPIQPLSPLHAAVAIQALGLPGLQLVVVQLRNHGYLPDFEWMGPPDEDSDPIGESRIRFIAEPQSNDDP